jgi:hypothetical protein
MAPELASAEWTLFDIALPPGYVGAAAVPERRLRLVECGFWTGPAHTIPAQS